MIRTITLPGLAVRQLSVGSMDNNVYLLTADSGVQLLIDAAADPSSVEQLVASGGPTSMLSQILTTHSHHDHIGALADIAAAHPKAVTLAGAADADAITVATGVPIERSVEHGDELVLGGLGLAVIGLRGHTPGSVAVAVRIDGAVPQLFTGDSLFPGGVGNTGGDPQRFASLLADVESRIFEVYPDETVVWPGHGLPTTIGAERPHLDEWRVRGW